MAWQGCIDINVLIMHKTILLFNLLYNGPAIKAYNTYNPTLKDSTQNNRWKSTENNSVNTIAHMSCQTDIEDIL